jgi:septum formation protein
MMHTVSPQIILASGSPRRLEILRAHGLDPEVVLPDINEDALVASWSGSLSPDELVLRLALHKARAVYEQLLPQACEQISAARSDITSEDVTTLILAADTVVYREGIGVLGKPSDYNAAVRMLQALNNTEHQVITGVALVEAATGQETSFTDTTTVRFDGYTRREILDYLAAEPPFDKAGSYAIQGLWGKHVMWLRGDYENVMGLPLYRLEGCIT